MTLAERARVLRRHNFEPDGIAAILGVDVADVVASHSDPAHEIPAVGGFVETGGSYTLHSEDWSTYMQLDYHGYFIANVAPDADQPAIAIAQGGPNTLNLWGDGRLDWGDVGLKREDLGWDKVLYSDAPIITGADPSTWTAGLTYVGHDGIVVNTDTATQRAFEAGKFNDAIARIKINSDGKMEWGDGAAAADLSLGRELDVGNNKPVLAARMLGFELIDDVENPLTQCDLYGNSVWAHLRDWTAGGGLVQDAVEPRVDLFKDGAQSSLYPDRLVFDGDTTLTRVAAKTIGIAGNSSGLVLHESDGTARTITVEAGVLVIT